MVKIEKKQTAAYWPRGPGSALRMSDKLQIVYNKYSPETEIPENSTVVNFIFSHGTGMNKSVWKSHIAELYKRNEASTTWKVGCVLSVDAAGHGDSALLNAGKLSWGSDWRDGAKDLIAVVKHEIDTTGDFSPSTRTRNILVGHSFGGYSAIYASFLDPSLFDACVAIEPVIFIDEGVEPIFLDRMKKVNGVLKEEFSSREEADVYFKKKSFYKVMDPKVLADFMEDEIYCADGKYKTKASKDAQLAAYLSAVYSLKYGQNILSLLEVPFLFITGLQAAWNSPNSDEHIETSVPAHLLERAKLQGDHLVHASNVGGVVDEIYTFTEKRVGFIREHEDDSSEVRIKRDGVDETMRVMFQHMWKGEVGSAFQWDRPKPKL